VTSFGNCGSPNPIEDLAAIGGFGSKPQLLQRLDANADLVDRLADRIRSRDRAVDQDGKAVDRRESDQRAAECPDAGAQQLRLGNSGP
jgi:hypothetical protein